jgi:hypothetical protein
MKEKKGLLLFRSEIEAAVASEGLGFNLNDWRRLQLRFHVASL